MSYNLVLNQNNVTSQGNNTFRYNFINGSFTIPDGAEISLASCTIPYSWFNISKFYGNNSLVYYIPNSSNVQTAYTVTISDGTYTANDLNNVLQNAMRINGHYWYSNIGAYSSQFQFVATISTNVLTINSTNSPQVQLIIGTTITGYGVTQGTVIVSQTGPYTYTLNNSQTVSVATPMYGSQSSELSPTIIYPLTIAQYTPTYSNSITSITIPTAATIANYLGAGFYYANGLDGQSSWTGGYPTSGNQCAYISIPTTVASPSITSYTIGNFLGFTSGSYPSTNSSISASVLQQVVYSNSLSAVPPFPPLGSIVNNIVILCSLVSNPLQMPSTILDSFPITSTFGSNINYLPISDNTVSCKAGTYQYFTIQFCDGNFNLLQMNDPNILVTIMIKFPTKK
jgi:hypothetical protein